MNRLVEYWQDAQRDAERRTLRLSPSFARWYFFSLQCMLVGIFGACPLYRLHQARDNAVRSVPRESAQYAATRYRVAAYRDTVRAVIASHTWAPREALWTYIDPALPSDAQRWADSTMRAERLALGTPVPEARVAVLFLLDTIAPSATIAQDWNPTIELLPAAAGGACVRVVRVNQGRLRRISGRGTPVNAAYFPGDDENAMRSLDATSRNRMLGTCAYFFAFGAPGPAVAAWLDSARWRPVSIAAWDRVVRTPIQRLLRDVKMSPQEAELMMMLGAATSSSVYASMRGQRVQYRSSVACLAGEVERCPEAIAEEPRRRQVATATPLAAVAMPGVIGLPDGSSAWEWGDSGVPTLSSTELGSWGHWMVQRCGREAFGRFWRSAQPIGAAYAAACGEPFDVGIHHWMQDMHGPQERGPQAPWLVLASASLLSILAVGYAVRQPPPQV